MKNDYVSGVPAEYKESENPKYRGNPYIECLPDNISEAEVFKIFSQIPAVYEYQKELPQEARAGLTSSIKDFLVPFQGHVEVARSISEMIKSGYVNRNPVAEGNNDLSHLDSINGDNIVNSRNYPDYRKRKGGNLPSTKTMIGISGGGKSTCLYLVLNYFPQVIRHTCYKDEPLTRTQIVYLYVSCPPNASPRAFCLEVLRSFDRALGVDFHLNAYDYVRYGIDGLIDLVSRLMLIYGVGILCIDEINNLSTDSRDAVELTNLLVSIVDLWKVPVFFVGTPKAQETLDRNLRTKRRMTSEGIFLWDRIPKDSADWETLITFLWNIQYTKTTTELTPELSDALYEATQGIPSLVVSVFRLVQQQVIFDEENEEEVIRPEDIYNTMDYVFPNYKKLIKAVKDNDTARLIEYEDIIINLQSFNYDSIKHSKSSDQIRKVQKAILKNEQKELKEEVINYVESFLECPNVRKEDLLKLYDKVSVGYGTKDKKSLKKELMRAAIELDDSREKQLSEERRKKDLARKNLSRARNCQYLKLFKQAQQKKQSVYTTYFENELIGLEL